MRTNAEQVRLRDGDGRIVDLAAYRAARAREAARPALPMGRAGVAGLSPRQVAHRRRMLAHLVSVAVLRAE